MDVLINIIAFLFIVFVASAVSSLLYLVYGAVTWALIDNLDDSYFLSKQGKERFQNFNRYFGMFLAFLLFIRIIFWWLMPQWNCYWNNICLS